MSMSDDSSNRTDVSTIHLDNISLQNRENVDESNSKYLGFDLSTQQLKSIVIDDKLRICHNISVDFDAELSEYKTRGGVLKNDDGSVTAPVNMWLKALDICMDKLKVDGLDFSTVLAISGCAQQHGSVWWRRESSQLLANLNPDEYLHKELMAAFSLRDTPIWMDSSTSAECKLIEANLGSPQKLAEITGSRAYERFTGAQIAKIMRNRREVYLVTERITLISNFLSSIFCGSYAPLDASDASGMNMMELRSKRWSDDCLKAIVTVGNQTIDSTAAAAANLEPDRIERELVELRKRLGCTESLMDDNIVDSHEVVGRISRYFVERYGFPPECLISSFTGDNPASMAGLCVSEQELIISLGTSDTAFFWLQHPHPGINGHVLRNPLNELKYMGLICFKNGSKTRERFRDLYAGGSWQEFERLLELVPRGNFGNVGFFYDLMEIYPLVSGDFRYNKSDERVELFAAPEIEIRACVEGQFLRLYHHSQELGLDMENIRRVLVTGGASANRAILQVIADIFRKPVFTLDSVSNSACLGGAYLSKYAYELEQQKLDQSFTLGEQHHFILDQAVDGDQDELGRQEGAAPHSVNAVLSRREKSIDFTQMILGSSGGGGGESNSVDIEENRQIDLIRAADPTPIGGTNGVDVYESLLARYVALEAQIAINNDDSINQIDT